MADTFTCDCCGGTFDKGWSEKEAAAESRELWGVDINEDPTMAVICDDCDREFKKWATRQGILPDRAANS